MILSKSYKEVINKIHVDDAMKQRILQNIEQEQRSSSKDNRGEKNMKQKQPANKKSRLN